MSKVLKETLKMDLPALAEMLRSKGRGKDTVLAHITPKEAVLLKRRGGRGSTNPDTGLLEFDDGADISAPAPVEQAGPTYSELGYTPAPEQAGPPVSLASPSVQESYTGSQYAPTSTPAATDTSGGYGISPTTGYNITAGAPLVNAFGDSSQAPIPSPLAVTQGSALTPAQQSAYGAAGTTDTTKPSYGDRFLTALTDPNKLIGLGLATGLGAFGASQARKTAGQVQAAQGQEQAIATPYQQQGQTLVNQAQAGQLSPASQQAFQAAQAQINQQVANRGGVGTQQAANQMAAIYQNLLNNQYTYGLNVMQIGDNISLGAIKTGLQLDTQLNQATTNFYSQLAQMVGGGSNGVLGSTGQTLKVVNANG